MRISGRSSETFLFLNGLDVARAVWLRPGVELQPARWNGDVEVVKPLIESGDDLALAMITLPRVRSQLRVTGNSPREAGVTAWNALWDATLLSAFCDCEAVCNLQADASATELGLARFLQVTNYHYRGLSGAPHVMTDEQQAWIQQHFTTARGLMDDDVFQSAIHALATYRWHSVPRARMALLWAGIEGLFKVESEIVFRLSLYVARFIFPDDADPRRQAFERTKRLYKARSAAVHGGEMKGDTKALVADSASLLRELLSRCVTVGALPEISALAP